MTARLWECIRPLLWCLFIGLGVWQAGAYAGAEVRQTRLLYTEEGLTLQAVFAVQLSPSLTDAVNHGMPLVFQIQGVVRKPRWYWVDETLFSATTDRRLTYNALVRNYRVIEGQDGRNFQNLSDALDYVARPVNWGLAAGRLRDEDSVEAAVRFRLDPAFLPKPFQVASFGDREWRLDSDWRNTRLQVPVYLEVK